MMYKMKFASFSIYSIIAGEIDFAIVPSLKILLLYTSRARNDRSYCAIYVSAN